MIFGNGEINDIRLGDEPIQRVFAGDELVWEKERPLCIYKCDLSSALTIGLPVYPVTSVTVDWGDGNIEKVTSWNRAHTYLSAGTYEITVAGDISRVQFYNTRNYTAYTYSAFKFEGNHKKLTSFYECFRDCTHLTNLPEGIFDNCPNVTTFYRCFYRCTGLNCSIPEGFFDNCPNVISFSNCFESCVGITSIPKGIFDNCVNVEDFSFCFSQCFKLKNIPESLFDYCPLVTTFYGCFNGCRGITSIPEELFDNCPMVRFFNHCFFYCENLTRIPEGLFDNCPQILNISSCFEACSALTGLTPKTDGVELWNRSKENKYPDIIIGSLCFHRCTRLDNYAAIPTAWKSYG